MKILIDMNLSPAWVEEFASNNIEANHWQNVGLHDAPDSEIVDWARRFGYIVFTHDLDFGNALALSKAQKPSIIQVRTKDVTIGNLSPVVIPTIKKFADALYKGALIVIDQNKQRVRILPL